MCAVAWAAANAIAAPSAARPVDRARLANDYSEHQWEVVHLRRSTLACLGLLLMALVLAGTKAVRAGAAEARASRAAVAYLGRQVLAYEADTWHWQHTMGLETTPTARRSLAAMSVGDAKRTLALWRRRARHARIRAQHPPHLATWLCIHHYEASWTDPYGPYYGGLQMDVSFQRRYAPRLFRIKGTADHWTPLEQIWTAVRAARTRGYWPWPNTARVCGVL
jgi:hypothetical protein